MNVRVIGLAVATALTAASCGPNLTATPTSPTTTTPGQSPFVSRVNGFYDGALVLANVSGGECAGDFYRARLGTADVGTVVINQSQTDVTAVIRSSTTGVACRYQGAAGLGAFSLHTQQCEVPELLLQCANGAARVLEQVGSTMTAQLAGTTVNGTVATWFNVFAESTEEDERVPVAGLILEQQFTAVRR